MSRRRWIARAAAVLAVLALSACRGAPGVLGDRPTTSRSARLTVGGARFTEMQIMEALYGQLLTAAGYEVDYKSADRREAYVASLESGEVDVVPEYAATFAEYLNGRANGPQAATIATSDAAATVAAMRPLAAKAGLTVLQPAPAADQTGYAVATTFAAAHRITALSQLAAVKPSVVLAATAACARRPLCQPGLERTYGLQVSKLLPLGFGSPQAKQAVLAGRADLALVATTDATLHQQGLTLLADDKKLQLADNLVPVVNTASAGTAEVADVLNPLSGVLTTQDLALLNLQVDGQQRKPEDVAKAYLTAKGLL